MIVSPAALDAFLAGSEKVALVRLAVAKGSTPRAAGTWMLVSEDGMLGTIGGGQMEFWPSMRRGNCFGRRGRSIPCSTWRWAPKLASAAADG